MTNQRWEMFRLLVGEELVTTGPGIAGERVTLVVDDALAIAERCWDAGFEVRVREGADETTIVVIDPFGRELEVVSSTGATSRMRGGVGGVSFTPACECADTDRQSRAHNVDGARNLVGLRPTVRKAW